MSNMIRNNLYRTNQHLVTRFLQISHHPMAVDIIDLETRQLLAKDPIERVHLYKAPIYLACTLNDSMAESLRARILLTKVASFDRATPSDLNVIIRKAYQLAIE